MTISKTVFIGFMGAGKSTAARAAAHALGADWADSDEVLEQRLGRPIAQLFEQDGEAAFRREEEQAVLELLGDRSPARVVSLGGGAVLSERAREALGRHTVVWVDVDAPTAWARVQGSDRPLARVRERFEALHFEREPLYAQLADVTLPASRSTGAPEALAAYASAPAGTKLLWAASASGDYPVYVANGLITEERFWPGRVGGPRFPPPPGPPPRLYGELLEPLSGRVAIMPGEQSKTVAHAEIVWTELVRAGMTRADVVVALGGGVVGDLAGFCAATFQRGVRWVGVPTSLVAQVDSAYGGKTGVDLPEAKNYVGAYHQPSAVLVDPFLLATLPDQELASGYAEVVKTALIAGGRLWEQIRAGADPADREIIAACALTKLRVVGADERDGGLRQVLNLGHTVGHAIETVTGYGAYRHGEAVALGLLAALRLSGLEELRDEVRELLAARRLPTRLTGADPEEVVLATARDKKRLAERPVPFVLLDGPGSPRPGCEIDAGALRAAVQELAAA
jgi:shikimate kinase/3-dehydroquinate synthase